jgi:hypothetical protein
MVKQKQVRMTLHDTLATQDKLRDMVKLLINENRPLTQQEKQQYYQLLPNALLSQGATDPVYFVKEDGWFIFESVQTLAHRMGDLTTCNVNLKTTRPKQVETTISIGELWKFLYRKMLYLFPQANSEAIHLSAESIERQQQKSFKFSSKEDLNAGK